jgi:hypothetical protein
MSDRMNQKYPELGGQVADAQTRIFLKLVSTFGKCWKNTTGVP